MFKSFFFAGYECATGYNRKGEWIDQVVATHHDQHVAGDYRRLREVGLHAAREAIRWPLVDKGGGNYDFSSVGPFVDASLEQEIEIIWDLFHFGYPDRIDLFSPDFPKHFADYCFAVSEYLCGRDEGPFYFTPINEPSYFAWAGGEAGHFAPHAQGRGKELKIALASAAIQGINAIRAVSPPARIVNVDPICHVAAPDSNPELQRTAEVFNNCWVYESWDMLAGRLMPELGGSREHLDIVGMNYYWTNQWELGREGIPLASEDPRLVPLRELVRAVWQRYGGDVLITETTHLNELRPGWLRYVADETEALLEDGVSLRGVCLYPILGMSEWHSQEWMPMGLWDLVREEGGLSREVCEPMLWELRRAQRLSARRKRRAEVALVAKEENATAGE